MARESIERSYRRFCLSLIALFLSVLMLVGTTVALFMNTSTVYNTISTGTVSISLYHYNHELSDLGKDEELVMTDTALFHLDQWEPGMTVYERFKVVSNSNINIKYRFYLDVVGNNTVKSSGADLTDVLQVALVNDLSEVLDPNFDGYKSFDDFDGKTVDQLTPGASDTFFVVIKWPSSTVDNHFNIDTSAKTSDGKPIYIDLGIRFYAVQENGSF